MDTGDGWSDLAEFERQANGNPTVPGIDAWNTFPGDVVELQEVNSDIYRRGVVIECFKRAKQVDIKMVEYGNHVIRAGTERVRRVWSNLHKELRWRVFFVCFFRPQASLSPEDLRAIQELLPRENVEAEVRCVRYQGRVCIGEMLITRLGLRESL